MDSRISRTLRWGIESYQPILFIGYIKNLTCHPKREVTTMARNTSVSLGDHFGSFIEQQISHGRYGSASEVVRAGLRQLEEHEARLTALRAALAAGESSGDSAAFDVDAFLKTKRHKLAAARGTKVDKTVPAK